MNYAYEFLSLYKIPVNESNCRIIYETKRLSIDEFTSNTIYINKAKEIAEELKTKGFIDRSYITGLQVQSLNQRIIRYLDIPVQSGVIIVEIEKGSPADKAQLELGDIILSVNGIGVKSADDIKEIILSQDIRSGDEIQINIYRNRKEKFVKLKLGKVKQKTRFW